VAAGEWQIEQGDGQGNRGLRASRGRPDKKAEITIIWLHGLGDTADGWIDAFLDGGFSLPERCDIILPTAETRPITINNGMRMPGWYDILGLAESSPVDTNGISQSVQRISSIVRSISSPIILGGFSQGGAIALTAALSQEPFPSLIGIIGASCYLPNAQNYDKASDPNLRFLLCHGDSDDIIIPQAAKLTHTKLQSLGLQAQLNWYKGMGHSACKDEFDAMSAFIQARLSESASSPS